MDEDRLSDVARGYAGALTLQELLRKKLIAAGVLSEEGGQALEAASKLLAKVLAITLRNEAGSRGKAIELVKVAERGAWELDEMFITALQEVLTIELKKHPTN